MSNIGRTGGGSSDIRFCLFEEGRLRAPAADQRSAREAGGTETFASFSRTPLVSGGRVVFVGANGLDGEFSQNGVYTDLEGALHVVADRNTAIPGSIGSFHFQFTVRYPAFEFEELNSVPAS